MDFVSLVPYQAWFVVVALEDVLDVEAMSVHVTAPVDVFASVHDDWAMFTRSYVDEPLLLLIVPLPLAKAPFNPIQLLLADEE